MKDVAEEYYHKLGTWAGMNLNDPDRPNKFAVPLEEFVTARSPSPFSQRGGLRGDGAPGCVRGPRWREMTISSAAALPPHGFMKPSNSNNVGLAERPHGRDGARLPYPGRTGFRPVHVAAQSRSVRDVFRAAPDDSAASRMTWCRNASAIRNTRNWPSTARSLTRFRRAAGKMAITEDDRGLPQAEGREEPPGRNKTAGLVRFARARARSGTSAVRTTISGGRSGPGLCLSQRCSRTSSSEILTQILLVETLLRAPGRYVSAGQNRELSGVNAVHKQDLPDSPIPNSNFVSAMMMPQRQSAPMPPGRSPATAHAVRGRTSAPATRTLEGHISCLPISSPVAGVKMGSASRSH